MRSEGFDHAITDANKNRAVFRQDLGGCISKSLRLRKAGGFYTRIHHVLVFDRLERRANSLPSHHELDIVRLSFDLYCFGPEGGVPMSAKAMASHFQDLRIQVAVGCEKSQSVRIGQRSPRGKSPDPQRTLHAFNDEFDGVAFPCDAYLVREQTARRSRRPQVCIRSCPTNAGQCWTARQKSSVQAPQRHCGLPLLWAKVLRTISRSSQVRSEPILPLSKWQTSHLLW